MSFGSAKSNTLQQAQIPVVSYKACSTGNAAIGRIDNKTMVCAGYGGEHKVSGCHGDSGGPFVCEKNGRWYLRGAVSWGDPKCGGGTTYSVFVRISNYVRWINKSMRYRYEMKRKFTKRLMNNSDTV